LTKCAVLPLHTTIPAIIHLPALLGGLGLRDPIATAIPAALTTFTCSIQHALHGIPCTGIPVTIPNIHKHWCFQHTAHHNPILSHYGHELLSKLPQQTNTWNTMENFIRNAPCHYMESKAFISSTPNQRRNKLCLSP
jgi:hypothetical protein